MDLLTYFAFPIATIILAFAVEKVLRLPILTSLTAFAIYLIVAFSTFDSSFLVYVIIYTVLAYISALIAEYIYTNCRFTKMNCNCGCNNINDENIDLLNNTVEDIAQRVAEILTGRSSYRRR